MIHSDTRLDEATAFLMQRAVQTMGRDIDRTLREHRITMAQRRVLGLLSRGQGITPSAVSAALQLDGGATTRLLDRLLAKRLCQGPRDSTDRRSVQVQITELGQSVLDASERAVAAVISDWFSAVDASQLDLLRHALTQMLAANADGSRDPSD